jgi:hypothetical protein
MTDKKQLGQFYTTNYTYILEGLTIPKNVKYIIEPFVGNGDLLKFIPTNKKYIIEVKPAEQTKPPVQPKNNNKKAKQKPWIIFSHKKRCWNSGFSFL